MACAGGKYDALFGRDSILIATILLDREPELAKNVLTRLSLYQGKVENNKTEESPGKILHELRENRFGKYFGNKLLDGTVNLLWNTGGKGPKITYFSADSTPLFVKLYCKYVTKYGDDLGPGVFAAATSACSWIENNINSSGLVEVARRNFFGNFFGQTWKDSLTAYILPNGRLVKTYGRIIFPEIQTLCLDALSDFAMIIRKTNPDSSLNLILEAQKLRENTLKMFWSDHCNFFASCLIWKGKMGFTPVLTLESSCGRMLDSSLFDDLPKAERIRFTEPIVRTLSSKEFLTDVGIRSRALRYSQLLPFIDYHGSMVSWPIDTYTIASGVKRQGYLDFAKSLEARILNALRQLEHNYEFYFVDQAGKVLTESHSKIKDRLPIQFTPEKKQGWTIALNLKLRERTHLDLPKLKTKQMFYDQGDGIRRTALYLVTNILNPTQTEL